ncbi:MAG TPA: hypothetical protein PKY35_05280 [Candidatus Hydrogenedentes bacterium]|nr:hypothetical protein [Candidatus Hydrogenedentota bacterium]HOL76424.1 hypothetical protein [Candidatus Hydrogenedentota bacterium]HPO85462.1 hypothetical protein [Candidatus Hydrogenedentota bacterium]
MEKVRLGAKTGKGDSPSRPYKNLDGSSAALLFFTVEVGTTLDLYTAGGADYEH